MLVSGLPRQHYCGTGGRSSWQFGRAWLFLPGFCPALLDLRNLRNAVSGWRLSQSWTDRVDRSIFWGRVVIQKDRIIENIETRRLHAPWDYDVKVREAGAKILDAPKINLNSLLHQADLSSFYRLPLISYLMDIIISINHGDNFQKISPSWWKNFKQYWWWKFGQAERIKPGIIQIAWSSKILLD